MRIDPNYIIFMDHSEWYTFDKEIGYVPTKEAPKEAVEAMKKYNRYAIEKKES